MQPRKDDMTHASNTRPVALRMIVGAAAVIAALLAFVPAANAARDPISGGTTDLHLKKGFLKKLTNLGVGMAGISTGQVSGNKISLPVTEGMFDPTNAQGHITSLGGFQLVMGARTVPISDVEVNTVHGFLRANIAGAHMQLGTFANPTTGREGFGARVKAGQLMLTQKAATRISNKLGLKGARRIPSRVMSNEFNITVPQTVTILGQGEATLETSPAVVKKFGEKGVQPSGINPIAPAKQPKATDFTFPITGGIVAQNASTGSVTTQGGVEILKKGKTLSPQMKITNLNVEFQQKTATVEFEVLPKPPLQGQLGRSPIVELVFPSNSITTNPTTRQITIKGAEGKLQGSAASTLNSVFNQGDEKAPPASSEFAAGELFGTFSMTLQAQ
ncbi:MAG TPA: HtaA domain-containing protein [Solirubrobacterales bacterium]|nr:HtaA domain-containing protein [Solirubrobacterales bacterium]